MLKSEKQDYQNKLDIFQSEKEEMISNHKQQIDGFAIKANHKAVMDQINFVDGMDDIRRAGFNSVLENKVKMGLNENGEFVVTKTDGKPFKDENDIHDLEPRKVYEMLAKQHNLLKMNNGEPQKPTVVTPPNNEPGDDTKKNVIPPHAQKRMEENQKSLQNANSFKS